MIFSRFLEKLSHLSINHILIFRQNSAITGLILLSKPIKCIILHIFVTLFRPTFSLHIFVTYFCHLF